MRDVFGLERYLERYGDGSSRGGYDLRAHMEEFDDWRLRFEVGTDRDRVDIFLLPRGFAMRLLS